MEINHKKGQDFDEYREASEKLILRMNLREVRVFRERLKERVESIHVLMREKDIKDERKNYLKGLRKVTTELLAVTKNRITTFNRLIHNGTQIDFAKVFMDVAASELDFGDFQRIYGKAASLCEIKAHKIEDVARFIEGAQATNKDAEGNHG